jgi:hypothetical protein
MIFVLSFPYLTESGGELCLLELGLVVELRNGDAIIFKSSQVNSFQYALQRTMRISCFPF